MDDTNYIHHKVADVDKLLDVLERIARAQEGMLSIAAEARVERQEMAKKLSAQMKAGFMAREEKK